MEYKGIKFDAIIATPGAGKTFLCEKYPNMFTDADKIKLGLKYEVPTDITTKELEITKGERTFKKRADYDFGKVSNLLDKHIKAGKIIIAPPNPEFWEYFGNRNIPVCLVYPAGNTRKELAKRLRARGNPKKTVQEFAGEKEFGFFTRYNTQDKRPAVKYEFTSNEFLEDIVKNFKVIPQKEAAIGTT